MPTDLTTFVRDLEPATTILFFGAGSSIPSHAPSVARIIEHLATVFKQPADGFTLAELADLIEQRTKDRRRLITEVRTLFYNLKPTGGLLNLPLYDWKSFYTTNYDELIELSYENRKKPIIPYSSNFDFVVSGKNTAVKLFKMHGTISKDISDGSNGRIIISGNDYNYTEEYREKLYDSFKADLAESNLVIIGHSLADHDIRDLIARAVALNAQAQSGGRITLLMYTEDTARATLYEGRGLRVVFGGINEFFAELARKAPARAAATAISDDPLDRTSLHPVTIDVSHDCDHATADVSRMFNGWPATYADIAAGLTFERGITAKIIEFFHPDESLCTVIVGASGVGKTTAARQVVLAFRREGVTCWEHKSDHTLEVEQWLTVARDLRTSGKSGLLFIDDAHLHLHELNDLIDSLVGDKLTTIKVIAVSGRNNWRPRVKTPNLFKVGMEIHLSRLDDEEIERLITLVERDAAIHRLVENTFAGFSRQEKRRRLIERCEADMFVCMRNIFATESFDDIILREYAELSEPNQDIYKLVAALESAGVRVHRQMIIRLVGISMAAVGAILEQLTDIITEYTISPKEHIYGWKGRHPVINDIITKYKFSDLDKTVALFDRVIDNIYPTYDIEIRSVRELCNISSGIARIPDKSIQNRLLRKMASVAPGERVPRHRLIRNLIDGGEFDQAQTEIRIFDKDFGSDGPVARYKINLMVARATKAPGIMTEDRVTILEQAREEAVAAIKRYNYTPQVFAAYCEVGFHIYRLTGKMTVFDEAMTELKEAENRIGDPQISGMIRRLERRIAGQLIIEPLVEEV
jgi:SIR2-like domain